MFTINMTITFRDWLQSLKDKKAKEIILVRLKRASRGNFGDFKSLGGGLYEMRVNFSKGYRIYYAQEGKTIYLILCGGDKSTQHKDIKIAHDMWSFIKEK